MGGLSKRKDERRGRPRWADLTGYYDKTKNAIHHKTPWSAEEVEFMKKFQGTDMELSAKMGRSVMAIQKMRSRIRKEDETIERIDRLDDVGRPRKQCDHETCRRLNGGYCRY